MSPLISTKGPTLTDFSQESGRWAAPRGDSMNGVDSTNGGSAGEAALGLLASRVEAIVRASDKQLKDPKDHSAKTKSVSRKEGF